MQDVLPMRVLYPTPKPTCRILLGHLVHRFGGRTGTRLPCDACPEEPKPAVICVELVAYATNHHRD